MLLVSLQLKKEKAATLPERPRVTKNENKDKK
jgi:hypothetical protein